MIFGGSLLLGILSISTLLIMMNFQQKATVRRSKERQQTTINIASTFLFLSPPLDAKIMRNMSTQTSMIAIITMNTNHNLYSERF